MALEKMLQRLEVIKRLPETDPGVYLHMGCGPQILPGFVNIDGYYEDPRVFKADIGNKLPFWDGTVKGIYSSHSLEHLPIRKAQLALKNWAKLLMPGGTLYLAVPDLEEICRIMIDPSVSDELKWGWYVYTLFGYQTNSSIPSSNKELDLPLDLGQFHTTGFTEGLLRKLIAEAELKLEMIIPYNGWSTPSLYLEARKN